MRYEDKKLIYSVFVNILIFGLSLKFIDKINMTYFEIILKSVAYISGFSLFFIVKYFYEKWKKINKK